MILIDSAMQGCFSGCHLAHKFFQRVSRQKIHRSNCADVRHEDTRESTREETGNSARGLVGSWGVFNGLMLRRALPLAIPPKPAFPKGKLAAAKFGRSSRRSFLRQPSRRPANHPC